MPSTMKLKSPSSTNYSAASDLEAVPAGCTPELARRVDSSSIIAIDGDHNIKKDDSSFLKHGYVSTHTPSFRKRSRVRLSNCLFYAIFAVGILSFTVTDSLIRKYHSGLAALMSQWKDDFVTTKTTRKKFPSLVDNDRSEEEFDVAGTWSVNSSSKDEKLQPKSAKYHTYFGWRPFTPKYLHANEEIKNLIHPRVFYVDSKMKYSKIPSREVELYPAEFSDNTQLYPTILDSNDVDMSGREMRSPYEDGDCVPMKEWQTAYYPSCNKMHEIDFIHQSNVDTGGDIHLFGTNGYWRNAWKLDNLCSKVNSTYTGRCNETVVLKTLKLTHNFEDAYFEHNRIDAMAMERLTSSPHVINIFAACGNSVITEYADGERVGTLADKSKKTPLARLKIARDIASGLADVHSIDGDDEATFAHFDINLANVVSIDGRLKLNDFNIGVMLKRNVTSGNTCGFPSRYPNPQWRSPEEATNSQQLSEKVDVFSLGHIFFRLICLHEPWHKLEPGFTKGDEIRKNYVNELVKKGVLPHIPKEVLQSNDAEVRIIREAMLACYTYEPEKRPTARKIANFLDRGIQELSKHTLLRKQGRDHWGSFRIGKSK